MDDMMEFADEGSTPSAGAWVILVVDDDPDVHAATAFSLGQLVHQGKTVRFHNAYSGKEAVALIEREGANIDLVLMDVVMEHPMAGIEAAHKVREILRNSCIPLIVMRTGQPGNLTEADFLQDPHIDGVLFKGTATRERLHATVIEGLDKATAFRAGIVPCHRCQQPNCSHRSDTSYQG